MGSIQAKLISSNGEVATYRLRDGAIVTLTLDPHEDSIKVTDTQGQAIGNMDVTVIENEHGADTHRLRNMYMDKQGDRYKRMGIGRACVEHYNAYYDVVLTAAQVGEDPGDGGHLTDNAPTFVAAMRREGLVK